MLVSLAMIRQMLQLGMQ